MNINKFIEKHKNKELEDGLNYGFTIAKQRIENKITKGNISQFEEDE